MARNEDILDRLLGSFSVRGILLHPATMFFVASMLMIGAAIFLWEKYSHKVINDEQYRLTEERIQLTPQPEWVDLDLKQLLIAETESEPGNFDSSLLDSQLVPRTAEIMRSVGYVERVQNIAKSKEGLNIEVVYRKPVALVELSQITFPYEWPRENRGKSIYLPVDRLGVVMPESLGQGKALPKILVVYPIDPPSRYRELESWTDWPDDRIKDAAAISSLFEKSHHLVGFARVISSRKPGERGESNNFYELWPDSGTQVIWGNAPGKEAKGEASAEDKFGAISDYVTQFGPLNKLAPNRIDVRTGSVVNLPRGKTASIERLFSDKK